jgi:prophage regulatory protein
MNSPIENPIDRIILAPERRLLVPYSDMQIWRMEKDEKFPGRIWLGPNRVGWILSEVIEWIEAKKAERSPVALTRKAPHEVERSLTGNFSLRNRPDGRNDERDDALTAANMKMSVNQARIENVLGMREAIKMAADMELSADQADMIAEADAALTDLLATWGAH